MGGSLLAMNDNADWLTVRVVSVYCRCAPDRGQVRSYMGDCRPQQPAVSVGASRAALCLLAMGGICGSQPSVGASLLAMNDNAGCLTDRVVSVYCRCAPDRGQVRSYMRDAAHNSAVPVGS